MSSYTSRETIPDLKSWNALHRERQDLGVIALMDLEAVNRTNIAAMWSAYLVLPRRLVCFQNCWRKCRTPLGSMA